MVIKVSFAWLQNAQLEKQYQEVLRELESKETDHMMETTQFREEISKLRTEMEGILQELQTLMDAKLSLELEICAYRKLLEGEENRSVPNRNATVRERREGIPSTGGSTGSNEDAGTKPVANKPADSKEAAKDAPKDSDK